MSGADDVVKLALKLIAGGAKEAGPSVAERTAKNLDVFNTANRLGVDTNDIAKLQETKRLMDYHKGFMGDIRERAQSLGELQRQMQEQGAFPMEVGTRFTTPHSQKFGQPPHVVTGYYVDPKNPSGRYGYRVRQEHGDGNVTEQMLMIRDPKLEALHGPEKWEELQRGFVPMTGPKVVKAYGGSIREGYQTKGRVGVVGDIVDQALKLVAGSDPQKTAKAYKLFKQREGKLYPLFVDANEEVPLNQWLKAKAGEQASSGQVKSKAGPLAYRPGWHAGDLPTATHIGAKSHGNKRLPPDTRRSDEVWAEVDMADDVDWQKVADERARITKKGTPDLKTAHITDQVPYGGFYRYKTSPTMQGNWMIGGDMRVNRVLTDDEVKAINDAAGVADLPRREGYGPGGWVDDVVKMAGKVISGEGDDAAKAGIRAYQGSPHNFAAERLVRFPTGREEYLVGQPDVLPDVPEGAEVLQDFPLGRMRMDKIGTGEGAQAYGHGLYYAEHEPVATGYRRSLAGPESMGTVTFDGRPVVSGGSPAEGWDDPNLILGGNIHARDLAETMLRHNGDVDAAVSELRGKSQSGLKRAQAIKNEKLRQMAIDSAKTASDMADLLRANPNRYGVKVPGHMYEVNINADPDAFLDWDKPLSEQGGVDRFSGLPEFARPLDAGEAESVTGQRLHQRLANKLGESGASSALRNAGIPGIKFLDAGSRVTPRSTFNAENAYWDAYAAHERNPTSQTKAALDTAKASWDAAKSPPSQTRNYVVFDDKLISIIRKYGIAGASAMLGYNLMEQLDPKQALAASMADQDYQSSRPQRSMGGNNSISGALNVARGLNGVE